MVVVGGGGWQNEGEAVSVKLKTSQNRVCTMGKAKPAKHTAAELKKKEHDALTNMGGGKAGKADRLGGEKGHAKFAVREGQRGTERERRGG